MKKKLITLSALFSIAAAIAVTPAHTVFAERDTVSKEDIVIGSEVIESSINVGDPEYQYNFKLERSGALTVKIDFPEGAGSGEKIGEVTLYDTDDKYYDYVTVYDKVNGSNKEYFTIDVMAGDYYLLVEYFGNGDVKYDLTTSFEKCNEPIPDTYEKPHNSTSNPFTLGVGSTVEGHLAINGSTDVYEIKVTKNCMLDLAVSNHTNGLELSINNDSKTVNNYYVLQEKVSNVRCFCPKGTYYISVYVLENNEQYAYGTYTIETKTSNIKKSKIKKLTSKESMTMSAKFKMLSVEDAVGYEIQYATDSKFKNGYTYSFENSDSLSSVCSLLMDEPGTHYARIRVYMEDSRGDRYYTKWSKAKKVTVKE